MSQDVHSFSPAILRPEMAAPILLARTFTRLTRVPQGRKLLPN